MRVADLNWMQLEAIVRRDDRAVLPLGSVEQHAYLSLATDAILAERVAVEAAEPLGVPVFPVLPYGITPSFTAFPGTVSVRVETYARVLQDALDSLSASGFRRILLVNGHGGNAPAQGIAAEWLSGHPGHQVRLHNWWIAPRTWAKVQEIDPQAAHASWMEGFPWTRVAGATVPETAKPMLSLDALRGLDPRALRRAIGDGSYGGRYKRPEEDLLAIWAVAVEETRALIETGWAPPPQTYV